MKSNKPRKKLNRQQIFDRNRSKLQAIAYRMLGTISDAEDVVQEAFIKWQQSKQNIRSPQAYLILSPVRKSYFRSPPKSPNFGGLEKSIVTYTNRI